MTIDKIGLMCKLTKKCKDQISKTTAPMPIVKYLANCTRMDQSFFTTFVSMEFILLKHRFNTANTRRHCFFFDNFECSHNTCMFNMRTTTNLLTESLRIYCSGWHYIRLTD